MKEWKYILLINIIILVHCKNRDLSYLTDEEFMKEINTVFEKFLEDNSEILNN